MFINLSSSLPLNIWSATGNIVKFSCVLVRNTGNGLTLCSYLHSFLSFEHPFLVGLFYSYFQSYIWKNPLHGNFCCNEYTQVLNTDIRKHIAPAIYTLSIAPTPNYLFTLQYSHQPSVHHTLMTASTKKF